MLDEIKQLLPILLSLLPILAGLLAVVWTFSKFYYKEKKQQKERTSHLTVKCKMEKVGSKESFNVVKFSLNIINRSDTKMYVLADYVNIYGISTASRQISGEEYLEIANEKIAKKKYAYLHRFVKLKNKMLVFCGKVFDYDDYWWLERNEKLQVNRIVYIPESFDYAEMIVTVYYSMDKDWLNVRTALMKNEKGLCHEVVIDTTKYKGEKFDWHNKSHLKLHNKYRNAEIKDSSLLFIK